MLPEGADLIAEPGCLTRDSLGPDRHLCQFRDQFTTDPLDEANYQGVAHAEGALAVGHAFRPAFVEPVDAFELDRSQAAEAAVGDCTTCLDATVITPPAPKHGPCRAVKRVGNGRGPSA